MSDDTYQGWTNRETWAVNLHLSNDWNLYQQTLSVIALALEDPGYDREVGPFMVANALEGWFGEMRDEWCDDPSQVSAEVAAMMREVGSYWRVDWQEVAGSFQED